MIERYLIAASSYASDVDFLVNLIAILVGFWFFLCQGVLFYFIFKYRRKPGVKSDYITGDEPELSRWIHIPHYLVLVCDVFIIIFAVRVWYEVKQQLPPPDTTVRVIGQQWAWSFIHPGPDNVLDTADDIKTVDTLRISEGTTYHYQLESRDVLHSFSIPVFRLKQDAVPGRRITGWFRATVQGTYDLQCAEICGIGHALMPAQVIVESPAQHAKWIAENAPRPMLAQAR